MNDPDKINAGPVAARSVLADHGPDVIGRLFNCIQRSVDGCGVQIHGSQSPLRKPQFPLTGQSHQLWNLSSQMIGHTDPRGTQEYNLALSEKRAQSVRDHLGRLGVEGNQLSVLPRGSLDAKGTDEPSWAQDRRVDFAWK